MKTKCSLQMRGSASEAAMNFAALPVDSIARVLLVDDHPTFREGLRSLINRIGRMTVSAEADDANTAMRLLETVSPHLMIVDLNLGKDNGLNLIQKAREAFPALNILVASMYEEWQYGERSINAGANGYVCKQDDPAKLVSAIERVCRGEIVVGEKLAMRMQERKNALAADCMHNPADLLSERELQIFTLIGKGFSTKEIGVQLNVSPKTVDSHREHLMRKLEIVGYTRLVHRAVEWVLSQ